MQSKTKKNFLTNTLRLVFFSLLFSMVVALPAQAQKTCAPCPPTDDSVRLQIYLPMKDICSCDLEGLTVRDGIVQKGSKKVYYIENIQAYISGLFTLSIGVLSLGAIVVIMLGGFQYVWAAGNQQKISSAKSMIAGALGGLALALLSYTLLNTINPQITSLQIKKVNPVNKIARVLKCEEAPGAKVKQPDGTYTYPKMFAEFPRNNTPLKDIDFKLGADETLCGIPHYIKAGAGSSCIGRICEDDELKCVNGNCVKSIISGTYWFEEGKFIDDAVDLWMICDTGGEVPLRQEVIATSLDDNLSYGEYDVAGTINLPNNCNDPEYFLKIEVNDDGGWDDSFYVAPHPGPENEECDWPIMVCDDNGTQTIADDNECPPGVTAVVEPQYIKRWALIGSPRLWTQSQIVAGGNVCNLRITEEHFPEDHEVPSIECPDSGSGTPRHIYHDMLSDQEADASPALTGLISELDSRIFYRLNSISDDGLFRTLHIVNPAWGECEAWDQTWTYGNNDYCVHVEGSRHYGGPFSGTTRVEVDLTPPDPTSPSTVTRTHLPGFSCAIDVGSTVEWSYECIEAELQQMKDDGFQFNNRFDGNGWQCERSGSTNGVSCGTTGVNHIHIEVPGCEP